MSGRGGKRSYSFELVPDHSADGPDHDHDPGLDVGRDQGLETTSPTSASMPPPSFVRRAASRLRALPRRRVVIASAVVLGLVLANGVGAWVVKAGRERERVAQLVASPGGVRSLADGQRELWSMDADGGPLAVLTGDLLVVRDGNELLGVEVATGTERWRTELGDRAECGPTPSSPAEWAQPAELLVCVSGPDEARVATVLDASGAVVGKRELDPIELRTIASHADGSALLEPSRFVLPAADGGLFVVERTGPRPEVTVFPSDEAAWEATADGLDVGQGARIRMEDAVSGAVRWEREVPFRPVTHLGSCASVNVFGDNSAVLDTFQTYVSSRPGSVVVFGCGVQTAFTPDGASLGDAPEDASWEFADLTQYVDGGYVVPLSAATDVLVDDSGRQVVTLPGKLLSPLATDGTGAGTMLVTAGSSELLALDGDGHELWTRRFVVGVPGAAAVVRADGVVVALDARGALYAIDLATGEDRWVIEPGDALPAGGDLGPAVQFAATDGRSAVVAVGDSSNARATLLVTIDLETGRTLAETRHPGDVVEFHAIGGLLVRHVGTGATTIEEVDGVVVAREDVALAGIGR